MYELKKECLINHSSGRRRAPHFAAALVWRPSGCLWCPHQAEAPKYWSAASSVHLVFLYDSVLLKEYIHFCPKANKNRLKEHSLTQPLDKILPLCLLPVVPVVEHQFQVSCRCWVNHCRLFAPFKDHFKRLGCIKWALDKLQVFQQSSSSC